MSSSFSIHNWIQAARPKTLTAAYTPVIIGASLAYLQDSLNVLVSLIALLCATLIQIGTNFANDYYDFKKGSDRADRVGFRRMTAAGLIQPVTMKMAAYFTMILALLVGLYLVYVGGAIVLAIGLSSLVFGIMYTGGPFPLGYNGLGDLFVFAYFGLVATMTTYYLNTLEWSSMSFWAALIPGALSTNILVVNNLRDVDQDRVSGKKTLGVLFGEKALKWEYTVLLGLAHAIPPHFFVRLDASVWIFLPYLSIPLSLKLLSEIWSHEEKSTLNGTLEKTAAFMFLYGVLFTIGLVIP
jgi:1,4-dihydroxy-2-naphthoate polyprenyltransferase